MSLYDYKCAKQLAANDPPFDALIMAAMRKADSYNFVRLEHAFPEIAAELVERYNAPGGRLSSDAPSANVNWEGA